MTFTTLFQGLEAIDIAIDYNQFNFRYYPLHKVKLHTNIEVI